MICREWGGGVLNREGGLLQTLTAKRGGLLERGFVPVCKIQLDIYLTMQFHFNFKVTVNNSFLKLQLL